jgi:hypothetical protein
MSKITIESIFHGDLVIEREGHSKVWIEYNFWQLIFGLGNRLLILVEPSCDDFLRFGVQNYK